jgi:eukaryotic-like serine/threonine-protein kinase
MERNDQFLSEERVAAYVRGQLSPTEQAEVEAAIDRQPEWLEVVAVLARDGGEARVASLAESSQGGSSLHSSLDASLVERLEREHCARLHPGTRLGRYEIEGPLGRGGMGIVYAAYDPELDRRVALKLLRGRDAAGQARLLREARALARLNDRRVITIYDVGTFENRVFLTMELLEGETLQRWRSSTTRGWREVLSVFIDAGRGLAAAHVAGLVHRDFKPANVMLTGDGRVVVLDFGLAHTEGEVSSIHEPEALRSSASADDRSVRTPQIVGTPAYMAPEQRRGEPCGSQTDQFSFCVALFEALHGTLPPQARPDARPSYAPAIGRLPHRVDRLLARGLASDARERHPCMASLVAELESVLRPRGRRAALALSLVTATAALSWGLQTDESEPCSGSADALAATWNRERATAVHEALQRSERPWSDRVRDEVDRRLNAYADAWIAEHEATCRATRVERAQSEETLDLRMHCLDRRRRSLDALLDVLAAADVEAASRAVQAVEALAPVSGCRDLEALRASVPLPADGRERAQAEALFDRVARVDALREATRYVEAADLASRTVDEAVALRHAPTEADARLAAGWVYMDQGEYESAEVELRAGLHAGELGRHDEAVTVAWNRLAWVVGYKLGRHDEGRRLAENARAWSQRLERRSQHELMRLRTLGWIEHEAGAAALALEHFEQALELVEELPSEDAVAGDELALVLNGLGAAALAAADLPRAERSFARAGHQLETRLGPDHPDVARVRNNVASLVREGGKADEARRLFEHNLAVFEAALGETHPLVGQTLINLSVAGLDLGRYADAEEHADRAVGVLEAAHGAEHPLVAKAHTIRGDARLQLHRPEEAIADFEHALELERRTLGPEHPSVGIVQSNLGAAYHEMGQFEEAAAHLEGALTTLEAALGPDHPNLGFVLMSLGLTRRQQGREDEALALFRRTAEHGAPAVRPNALARIGEIVLERGDVDTAIEHLERARSLQEELETNLGFVGDTELVLARARWASGDRPGAHAAARAAIAAYRAGGHTDSEAKAHRWLVDHAGALDPP